ncbi:uncharacterized protein LOC127724901 [Mytilus californianus]|uniref:uncharacterized protein LOC127724901 n=1 Tax=Mytilus californianus TaxID=6549 RepID=UPI0022466067|nr:uncharacterized protein LOC127724901 [Mytilus californianus]
MDSFMLLEKIPIHTYDSLVSYLTNGTRVTYFFNTTTCQPISSTSTIDLPIFGGEIKFFLTSKSPEGAAVQLIFNHEVVEYGKKVLNVDLYSMYIIDDTLLMMYGKPGFFANNTDNIKGVICKWPIGSCNFWVNEPATPKHLSSYDDIQKIVVGGDLVRFVITTRGCKCPPGEDCGDAYVGGDMKDFKITKEGTISFSKSMILFFPIPTSPMYYREVFVGNVHPNNTLTFLLSYVDATTWEIENGVTMACPIDTTPGHADFYLSSE